MSGARLVVLPADEITSPSDRFRCEPYKAILLASACVARQDAAVRQTQQDLRKPVGDRISGDYEKCLRCLLGARVALQLELAEPTTDTAQQGQEPPP